VLPLHRLRGPAIRLQVVVAHPDGEAFGCNSTLLHAGAAGATTAVVCGTRGEAGQVAPGADVPGCDLGAAREAELRAPADLLGVTRVDLLGFRDSDMTGDAGTERPAGADPTQVEKALAAAVDGFGPHVLVTLDGSDGPAPTAQG
jgi:LmbE family N-acetylglucosaminyl deacetylase